MDQERAHDAIEANEALCFPDPTVPYLEQVAALFDGVGKDSRHSTKAAPAQAEKLASEGWLTEKPPRRW